MVKKICYYVSSPHRFVPIWWQDGRWTCSDNKGGKFFGPLKEVTRYALNLAPSSRTKQEMVKAMDPMSESDWQKMN